MVLKLLLFKNNEHTESHLLAILLGTFYRQILYREMTNTVNSKYHPPNRDRLTNHLVPVWYEVEKRNLISDLKHVTKAVITADGWTSSTQDHYLTVMLVLCQMRPE